MSLSIMVFSGYISSSGIVGSYNSSRASQMVLRVESPLANAGDVRDVGLIPGSGGSSGEGNGYSNILAWRIPWTEELGGLQSMGSQRVGHD